MSKLTLKTLFVNNLGAECPICAMFCPICNVGVYELHELLIEVANFYFFKNYMPSLIRNLQIYNQS